MPKKLGSGKVKKRPIREFRDEFYVEAYKLARAGMNDKALARSLGTRPFYFKKWCKDHPALVKAVEDGRAVSRVEGTNIPNGGQDYYQFLAGRLPEKVRALYQKIIDTGKMKRDASATEKLYALVKDQGDTIRQQLFLYALHRCRFNVSRALRKVCITRDDLNSWLRRDPRFGELITEMAEIRKDFIDEALFKKIQEGDTSAIVFAARTQLADRGYSDKVEVNVTGSVTHDHTLNFEDMPLELQKQIIEWHRSQQKALGAPEQVIEAEYEVKESKRVDPDND